MKAVPRRATLADIDIMAAIHAGAFAPKDAWSRDIFGLHLAQRNVAGLLHPSGGTILVRIAATEAEVLTLAVLPEARRAGIGSALLHQATALTATMGVRSVFLEVSVANDAALRLYAAAGFAPVGRRPRYYSDTSDALVMRLDLEQSG